MLLAARDSALDMPIVMRIELRDRDIHIKVTLAACSRREEKSDEMRMKD